MINNEDLTTSQKMENQSLNFKEGNNSRYTLTSKSSKDSLIKEEEIEGNENINVEINIKERQLSILLDAFVTSYSKKSYEELIKDIEENEDLLYTNSLLSFEIKVIKIKCLMKLLKEEYNNYLQSNNKTFHELDIKIIKINHEFKIISSLIINNDSYQNEIITQLYCKFLFLLSKISIKREDYLKSLGILSLGINMLKIYIIRKKVASDIKTYKLYCKLLLELINLLIGDKNYDLALFYNRLIFKIIEISMKYIYYNNKANKKKIPNQTIKKFITYGGISYLYTGFCFEQLGDEIQAFEAFKEAKFFLNKISQLGISFQVPNNITINNSCLFIAEDVFKKYIIKFKNDKIERLNKQKKLELQKKKEEYEILQKEKLMKLKNIANGLVANPFKYETLDNELNEKLFPYHVVNDLEKMDDELTSFVYTYVNKSRKNHNKDSYKDKMSSNIKKFMSRYEIYNMLMSKNFRDFIMKNKKLQFYNPKTGSKSISIIQRYLNNKIQIESDTKKRNSSSKKSIKTLNINSESSKNIRILNTNENFLTITTSQNSRKVDEKYNENNNFKKNKKILYRNKKNNLKYLLSQDDAKNEINSRKKIYRSFHLKSAKSTTNRKIKYKLKSNYHELECDFERKNLEKNLMTKNYLRKYLYYDKLSSKELQIHKQILYFKNINTLYNNKRTVEEKNGLIGKDDLANISLIINENAKVKPSIDLNLVELQLIKDSFSKNEKMKSMKIKSAMSKAFSKYIKERKNHLNKKKIIHANDIKEINEKKILYFDYSIKNINNNISHVRYLSGKRNNK